MGHKGWLVVPLVRVAPQVVLEASDRAELERWSRSATVSVRLAERAKIVLLAAKNLQNKQIAQETGLHVLTVKKWRDRFVDGGLAGIESDAARSGRPRTLAASLERDILEMTPRPPVNVTHWSSRRLAKRLGVSAATVERVWTRHALRPHMVKRFKLSNDPKFEEKVVDIVGLYVKPPERGLVFCVDEKTQIQALDRTRPRLKVRPGLPEHQTHDYKRNGTLDLFAALDVKTGRVLHQVRAQHTHREFLDFLALIDRSTPKDLDLHVVLDNLSAHSTPEVKSWLAEHPRFLFHFTPTGSSWMNMVERIFGTLTAQRIRRGTFNDTDELQDAIEAWMAGNNDEPKPLRWHRSAADIIRKVAIYRRTYAALH